MYEELVPILHTRKKVAPVLHRCDEYLPILHTSEIINMRNLSTNFRPQNLSKLTIRKFHIWQMWRISTNSSYGCEIYEMRNLRFNIPCYLDLSTRISVNGIHVVNGIFFSPKTFFEKFHIFPCCVFQLKFWRSMIFLSVMHITAKPRNCLCRSQIIGVMSSAVTVPDHILIGLAGLVLWAVNQYYALSFANTLTTVQLESAEGREISCSISMKECCWPGGGSNPHPSVRCASKWATEVG